MENFDIIVIAGQSNAEGCGVGDFFKEYQPTEKVMQLDVEKTVEHKPEKAVVTFGKEYNLKIAEENVFEGKKIGNLALSFARKYIEKGLLKKDRKVLILRCGIGGTGFKKGHWGLHDDVYLKMLDMMDYALGLGDGNRLVAFLWHQGEHDAFERNPPEIFEKQLTDMISSIRNRYNEPKLPFIAGDFVQDWKNKNINGCVPIVEKIKKVSKNVGYGAFVETDGLLSNDQKNKNGDDIHFCREGLYELGERYFENFRLLIKKDD